MDAIRAITPVLLIIAPHAVSHSRRMKNSMIRRPYPSSHRLAADRWNLQAEPRPRSRTIMHSRDLIGKPGWTPATYQAIAVDRTTPECMVVIPVTGEVRHVFGLDQRKGDDGVPVWIVTRLPTGHRLPCEFLSRDTAVACVAMVEGLGCWTADDPEQMLRHPDAVLARRLVAKASGSGAA